MRTCDLGHPEEEVRDDDRDEADDRGECTPSSTHRTGPEEEGGSPDDPTQTADDQFRFPYRPSRLETDRPGPPHPEDKDQVREPENQVSPADPVEDPEIGEESEDAS